MQVPAFFIISRIPRRLLKFGNECLNYSKKLLAHPELIEGQ
jgi:hypothetical protein